MANIPPFFNITGCYKCKGIKCKACRFISHGKKSFCGKDGHTYCIKQFICCSTQFVIYGLRCQCGFFYVGRTVRAMWTCFGEHRRLIEKKIEKHSVPHHLKNTNIGAALKAWNYLASSPYPCPSPKVKDMPIYVNEYLFGYFP